MIDKTISFLLAQLNAQLCIGAPSMEPRAVASALVMPDGSLSHETENKIVLTVAGIERETSAFAYAGNRNADESGRLLVNPPLNLNLYLLVSSSFRQNYIESLRQLSATFAFFHSKPVFTPQNSPDFPSELQRMSLEMVNLSIVDQQNLWACQGSKYMPSGFYKARMLSLVDTQVKDRVPVVAGTDASV